MSGARCVGSPALEYICARVSGRRECMRCVRVPRLRALRHEKDGEWCAGRDGAVCVVKSSRCGGSTGEKSRRTSSAHQQETVCCVLIELYVLTGRELYKLGHGNAILRCVRVLEWILTHEEILRTKLVVHEGKAVGTRAAG